MKKSIRRISTLTSLTCALSALVPWLPARAQSSPTPASEANALQEIVVTATKREENIQRVPISIVAFSQAQLDQEGVRKTEDIIRLRTGEHDDRRPVSYG